MIWRVCVTIALETRKTSRFFVVNHRVRDSISGPGLRITMGSMEPAAAFDSLQLIVNECRSTERVAD